MRSNGVVLLDSYRLSQYAESAPCYICDGGNNFDAELCRHCFAPMALAHQASSQKIHPKMIAAIGPSGAGKTVYLGMLTDMLSRQTEPMQMLSRGAFSIGLQQTTMASLSRCEFPAKTPSEPDRWNWVHCQVLRRKHRPIELILPDLAGEALMEEIEHPHTYPVVRAFLAKCSGILVMVDASRVERGDAEEDFQTMKLISYLCELKYENRQPWGSRPVSLVFTKADECMNCFEDPHTFARQHAPGLFQQCRERLPKHRFFGVGVAGASAFRSDFFGRIHVPLRIEPRGIVEPFRWLIEELAAQDVMRIPQAIFTSLRGQRMAGYQLAVTSEEIGDDLARELNVWGPAHDSLLDESAEGSSVNFHPLGAEHFCLSLTSPAGAEYSGRAGARIYTQMFVLSREALARFDNNPFLILRAIESAGRAAVYDELPQRLRSIPLVGHAGEADVSCLEQQLEQLGPEPLSSLITAVLDRPSVGVATSLTARSLFSALFRLLPLEKRLKVSFTTGLRHSPRRPFRLFLLPSDPVAQRHFERQPGVTVVELKPAAAQNGRPRQPACS